MREQEVRGREVRQIQVPGWRRAGGVKAPRTAPSHRLLLLRATDASKREMIISGLLIIRLQPGVRVGGPPWKHLQRDSFPAAGPGLATSTGFTGSRRNVGVGDFSGCLSPRPQGGVVGPDREGVGPATGAFWGDALRSPCAPFGSVLRDSSWGLPPHNAALTPRPDQTPLSPKALGSLQSKDVQVPYLLWPLCSGGLGDSPLQRAGVPGCTPSR